jgi:hypothetical protein
MWPGCKPPAEYYSTLQRPASHSLVCKMSQYQILLNSNTSQRKDFRNSSKVVLSMSPQLKCLICRHSNEHLYIRQVTLVSMALPSLSVLKWLCFSSGSSTAFRLMLLRLPSSSVKVYVCRMRTSLRRVVILFL